MSEEIGGSPDETLVRHVRGQLPEPEATRIAARAAESPMLAAKIALVRRLAADVDGEAAKPGPGELGWARISRAIDAEASARPARPRWWQTAGAAAAAVRVWQVVAVPLLPLPPAGYAPVSESPGEAVITVAFVPAATETELRALLREIGAEVVGGPSAIGLWRVGDPLVESA